MAAGERSVRITGADADELFRLHDLALEEAINAILTKVADGKKPKRVGWPQLSIQENGMPSISDPPLFGGNGSPKYSDVLEPPWDDDRKRAEGKFSKAEFPAMSTLIHFVVTEPAIAAAYMEKPHAELLRIMVESAIEGAANMHFLRFGQVPSNSRTRSLLLGGILTSLTAERLMTPVVVPIALVRFDFARFRLAEDAILIRMSDGLQRARWTCKAWGASGHNSVLAAATHALVLTGWSISNSAKLSLGELLSYPAPQISAVVDSFFAALRLELGIATGYAQELRLAKGWSSQDQLGDPQVFAVGARRYPSWFDNFGWTVKDLPLVDRPSIAAVAGTWQALKKIEDVRMALALRRLNASMTREEPADAILDATIAMEVLLGDGDGQSISWKLRMRAAALIGLAEDRIRMEEMRTAIKDTYDARSAIVHGGKKPPKTLDEHAAADKAIVALRQIIKCLLAHPQYLDPLRIDAELLLTAQGEKGS